VKHRRLTVAVSILITLVVVVSVLTFSRHWIAKQSFMAAGRGLTAKLSPELKQKYGTDLKYTLGTFWKCYDRGFVSRNDLNDVMEKMSQLRAKKKIEDLDIFDFIGYVSRMYTDAIQRHQRDMLSE
jgi:hypothetical protein